MNASTKQLVKALLIFAVVASIAVGLFSSGKLGGLVPTTEPLMSISDIKATNSANDKELIAQLGTPTPTMSVFKPTSIPEKDGYETERPRENYAPVSNGKKVMLFEAKSPSIAIHSSEEYFRDLDSFYGDEVDKYCYDTDKVKSCSGGAVIVPGVFSFSEVGSFYDKNGEAVLYSHFVDLNVENAQKSDLGYYAEGTGILIDYIFTDLDLDVKADKIYLKELADIFLSKYIPEHPTIPAVAAYKTPSYTVMFYMDEYNFNTYIYKDAKNPPDIKF